MAGTPQQRADDIHALFADPGVAGILAVTGGSGANRVLPLLDYGLIARHPKFLGGFSDLTALIGAVHAMTGLVTFHSPLGRSEWNAFSIEHFQAVVMAGAAHTLRNELVQGDDLGGLGGPHHDDPRRPRASAGTLACAVVLLLGFASGLPLALTGQAMQAWLTWRAWTSPPSAFSAWWACPTPSSSCGRR
jgi:hypothetical protein